MCLSGIIRVDIAGSSPSDNVIYGFQGKQELLLAIEEGQGFCNLLYIDLTLKSIRSGGLNFYWALW